MIQKLILIGCGGHSKSIIDVIESSNEFKIEGLIGLDHELGKTVCGYRVIGTDKNLSNIRNNCSFAFIALGKIGKSENRKRIKIILDNFKFSYPKIKSSGSYISKNAYFGEGTSIGHGVVINAGANIGNHCIINSNSLIEHDVKIGNFTHVSTGALINGNVEIGENSFIGSGAIIRENLKIPNNSIISAGKRVMGWPLT